MTAEAPLLNVTTSQLGGNVDPQQVQELPVAGRNWMALALLAPGSRTSSTNAHVTAARSKRRRGSRVPAQSRRPADFVRARRRQPAAVQPGLDRRVPVHLEPVRRHAGPFERRAGERHHEVGHQPAVGPLPHELPEQQVQRGGSGAAAACCRSATSSTARRSAGRWSRTSCTTSATSSTSANPLTSVWNTPYPAFNITKTGS